MRFMDDVICPISSIKVDNSVSRLTVFFNAVLIAAYVFTGWFLLIAIVAIDYGIRATWNPHYSPIRWIAAKTLATMGRKGEMKDQAPKLFASRVGFLFALTSMLLFSITPAASIGVGAVLLVFTIMDSVFDFCVGCITYTYIVLPVYQRLGIR